MKYRIIQIYTQIGPNVPIFEPCFKIVGIIEGYESLADARTDKNTFPNPENFIIIQTFN